MFKLWRRSATPTTAPLPGGTDDLQLYDDYEKVLVSDDTSAPGELGSVIASRCFDDPEEAARVQAAWQRHAPGLTVRLRHYARTSLKPDYEGSYLHEGTWLPGQPPEIDALVKEAIAAAEAENARLDRDVARFIARQKALRPKTVVVAEAGDDLPHHDWFIKATQTIVENRPVGQVTFDFATFTGQEPKPVEPFSSTFRGTDQERALIEDEYAEATRLWTMAAYRLKAERALRAAAEVWPAVADALARIDRAWADLDHPPHGWEVAVKQLLDAHDAAKRPVQDWEDRHGHPLATLGADLVDHWVDLAELRAKLGGELGLTEVKDWQVGYVETDYHHGGTRYYDGAREKLASLVSSQRQRLEEIVTAAGRVTM